MARTPDGEWELRLVRRPPGTHRSKSSDTPGADRDLLRKDGTNELLGPTESVPVSDDDLYEMYRRDRYEDAPPPSVNDFFTPEQKAELEAAFNLWLHEIAMPWIENTAFPWVGKTSRSLWHRRPFNRGREIGGRGPTAELEDPDWTPAQLEAIAPEVIMSATEYEERSTRLRFIEGLVEEERRALAAARIADDAEEPQPGVLGPAAIGELEQGGQQSVVEDVFEATKGEPVWTPRS
jgi:hypothetical protein